MDLAHYDLAADAERGAAVDINDPRTGKPLIGPDGGPVQILVRGADGPTYRSALRAAQAAVQAAGAGDILAATADVLGASTIGWRNIILDGQPVEHSREAAASLFRRFEWLREQVEAAILDRSRFAPQTSK